MNASDVCVFVLEGRDRGYGVRPGVADKTHVRTGGERSPQERDPGPRWARR